VPDVNFPRIQRATLANGLKVMLLERHGAPLVNMSLAVDAGYAADPAAKAGLAALTLDVMDEGTATRDTFAIVNQLDSLGATIGTGNSLDMSFVTLSALPANLGKSLDIFADVVVHPAFATDMVALAKRQRLARIAQEKANPVAAVNRIMPRLLYGASHAYAKPLTGSGYVETLQPLERKDLAEWHRSWFLPNNATLVVAGDVTMDTLRPELERAFGSWKGGAAPRKQLDTLPRTAGKRVYLIDKPDAPQSVIVAAELTEPGGRAEDLAIETVMRNFGGIATSRLNRNLRLDKHWSYGTQGQIVEARGQRPLLVIAPVQTDKTKEALAEVAKEIRGVAGERPLAGDELQSAMRNQTMRLPGAFETLGSLQNAAIRVTNLGYPDDYFAKYAANVRALDETALNGAAKTYVRPDEVIWLVIGDLKKVEAGIRELGLGEVIKLDADGKPLQ
jgi:zinc protease